MLNKNTIRNTKLICIGIRIIGIIFLIIGFFMWKFGGNILGIDFSRTEIAHAGFFIVGFLYTMISLGISLSLEDEKLIIKEHDDKRNKMIYSNSGLIAFGVQSLLLPTSLFLLCFMGYMNVVSMFTLISVNMISSFVFFIYCIYSKIKI